MLGLGIGANVALFTVINAAFLRPLPFLDPQRLVFIYASYPGLSQADLANFSYPDFDDVRRGAGSFESIAAQTDFTAAALETTEGPARVQPNFVDGPYFDILGTKPALGRSFTSEEMSAGTRLIMLSHGMWERVFGADRSVLGRVVRLNGVGFEIIGVMPQTFFDLAEREGRSVDVWLPLRTAPVVMSTFDPANRSSRLLWGIARLKEGVTAAEAELELTSISSRLQEQYPDTNRGFGVHATAVRNIFFIEMRQPLTLLTAGAGFVLLIVCCNVALLLVSRGTSRRRELAVQLALGAGRGRILRQLITESLMLSLAASALSVAAAVWGTRALLAFGGVEFPGFVDIGIDRMVLGLTVVLAMVCGLGAGILPAVSGWRRAVSQQLTGSVSNRVAERSTAQLVLVAAQVAAAIVLVAGAWLMITSSRRLAETGLQFDSDNLLTMRIDLPADRYGQPADRARFGTLIRERIEAVPGVESATLWGPGTPGRATWVAFIAPEKRVIHSPADFQMVWRHSTNPGGLSDLGVTLLEGRDFTSTDTLDVPHVVIVSRTVANELWPGETATGQRMRTGTAASAPIATVIGVAEDVWMRGRFRFGDFDPRRTPQRDIFFPYAQRPQAGIVLLVRAAGDPQSIASPLRSAVTEVDSLLPTYDTRTMDEILRNEERNVRFAALLMSVYGVMALTFAGFGLYAVLSFAVVRRTREIGVRMALGAARSHVVATVVRSGVIVVAAGCAAGLAIVGILSPVVRALFYNVSPLDPAVLAGACATLVIAGGAACALPAWRAASVDPSIALRNEP
jgi:putative ABC transport system permease protein